MRLFILVFALLIAGCASQPGPSAGDPSDNEQLASRGFSLLEAGIRELRKNAKRAKEAYFDRVIAECESAFANSEQQLYYARTQTETVFYLLKAAAEKKPASVLETPCGQAHYLSGYASLDLGNVAEAESHLRKALVWSPVNPQFLSELAHIKQTQRDWQAALELFTEAEKNSRTFSPEEYRSAELARAKRGVGFTLIELGRLDDAEAKFNECLEIDADDEKAKHELKYIAELRAKGNE